MADLAELIRILTPLVAGFLVIYYKKFPICRWGFFWWDCSFIEGWPAVFIGIILISIGIYFI